MRASAKAEYACLAVLYLGARPAQGPPARVRDIAETHGIPERFLVQILLRLKGAGLVRSVRGASGGYQLARDPDEISVAEVIAAVDGDEAAAQAADVADPCARALRGVWAQAAAAEQRVLRKTHFGALLSQIHAHDWVI